ncbi:MAG: sugar ABC transporter ATP-binding protein, partial [Lachnospiraceae bacterium]
MLEMLLEKGMAVVILAVNLADSMSLADRLIRIRDDGVAEEIDKKDFGTLSVAAPWLDLYR